MCVCWAQANFALAANEDVSDTFTTSQRNCFLAAIVIYIVVWAAVFFRFLNWLMFVVLRPKKFEGTTLVLLGLVLVFLFAALLLRWTCVSHAHTFSAYKTQYNTHNTTQTTQHNATQHNATQHNSTQLNALHVQHRHTQSQGYSLMSTQLLPCDLHL